MSISHRVSLLAGVFVATLALFVGLQGTTQEARTQTANPTSAALPNADESSFQAPDEAKFVSGELLVKPRDGVSQQELEALNRQNDARAQERLPGVGVSVIELPAELPVQAAVRRYENSPDVQYAEPNFLLYPEATPNDPAYERLYGLNNTGQQYANGTVGTPDADMDAPEAWTTETGNSDTVVAVIDTGVQTSHPDLDGNLWSNPEEAAGVSGFDDDGNGYVDDVRGWDFCRNDNSVYDSATYDDHGTHLAGTIAAEGNDAAGITGVNWDAQIMSLKFLDESVPFSSTNPCNSTISAIKAIDYAVKEGARISNNSWGGAGYSQSLKNAIDRADTAGHLFVAAAGNGGDDGIGDDNDADEHYPSNYTSDNIISVAATDDDDQLANFSNYGGTSVDLGAPGVYTYSTVPNGYKYFSGTSMATSHVAGVAALLKSQNPLYSDEQMKDQILRYAEPKNRLQSKTATGGRLNAAAALTGQPAPDETRPTVTAPRPVPGSTIRDRTPLIGATVRDDRTELSETNIKLYLDGKQRGTFNYDANTDRLSCEAPQLSYARHTVRVSVEDAAGNVAVGASRSNAAVNRLDYGLYWGPGPMFRPFDCAVYRAGDPRTVW